MHCVQCGKKAYPHLVNNLSTNKSGMVLCAECMIKFRYQKKVRTDDSA